MHDQDFMINVMMVMMSVIWEVFTWQDQGVTSQTPLIEDMHPVTLQLRPIMIYTIFHQAKPRKKYLESS